MIDKYPTGTSSKPEIPNAINMTGRALRETKNNQLFEKYMNRH